MAQIEYNLNLLTQFFFYILIRNISKLIAQFHRLSIESIEKKFSIHIENSIRRIKSNLYTIGRVKTIR